MSTMPAARSAATGYLKSTLSGSLDETHLIGSTNTPEGKRLGFEIVIDQGPSIVGGVLGGLLLGLVALLLSVAIGLLLVIVGVPPTLPILLGSVVTISGVVSGARSGADASEVENVTVTVDSGGNVVMVNRHLSPGEFSRAIDREYDRQTAQLDHTIAQLSKHWILHKLVDKYVLSNRKDS